MILAVLLLMNTYPLLVSQSMVFRSKETAMMNSVMICVNALAGIDTLTEETVASAMSVVQETGLSRILVTDEAGLILYDSRESARAVGRMAAYSELVLALKGKDAFSSVYSNAAFQSRAAAPVTYRSQTIGAVYAYEYDSEQAVLLENLRSTLFRISVLIACTVAILSVLLSAMMTRKIRILLSAIRSVKDGENLRRVNLKGSDEITHIADAFNAMADRLQVNEEVRRRFVSDASHELKTPLAAIRLLSDSILQTETIDPATTRDFVAEIGQEAERLSRVSEDLLRLTRLDAAALPPAETVDVLPLVELVTGMVSYLAHEKEIDLTYEGQEGCFVSGTRDELTQVLYNLIENAVKYTPEGGTVQVLLKKEPQSVRLLVEDSGPGIPEQDLKRVFERFYRVDKARSRAQGGTGLGLSIVKDTVSRRGGSVWCENRREGGARFTVLWPRLETGETGGAA